MEIKYDNHPNEWIQIINDEKKFLHASTWLDKNTLDCWRHARIRSSLLPLINEGKNKKWMTIGDGRFGTDANYLMDNGVSDVTATDISDALLKIGAEKGFIKKYSAQNAEELTFANDEFDYTYCKESYHHFPRPYMAIYEMLRVSKYAITLTEPIQQRNNFFIRILRKITGKKNNPHIFETVGNYVYTISTSEIEKLMLGIGLRHYAFIGINDYYIPGIENTPIEGGNFKERMLRLRVKFKILTRDILSNIGFLNHNLITLIIYKIKPTNSQIKDLKSAGFNFISLPINPYTN